MDARGNILGVFMFPRAIYINNVYLCLYDVFLNDLFDNKRIVLHF